MCSLNNLARLQAKLRELSLLVEELAVDASRSVESPPVSPLPLSPSPPSPSPPPSPRFASPAPTSPSPVQQQRLASQGHAQPGRLLSARPPLPRAARLPTAAPADESPRVSNAIMHSQNVTVRAKAQCTTSAGAGVEDDALWRALDACTENAPMSKHRLECI